MADEGSTESSTGEPRAADLGLRSGADRRTHRERRSIFRGRRDRRRGDRRRSTLRGLILSALTLAAPPTLHRAKLPLIPRPASGPKVKVAVQSFDAIPPAHAYDNIIKEAAALYGLEPALIRSVMRAESGFNPFAVSRVGAMGLMQLMPDVADELGVTDPFDPRQNIMGGSHLLRDLLDRNRGNIATTLASYNAGPRRVAIYRGRIPPFRETRDYVKRITAWLAQERAAAGAD